MNLRSLRSVLGLAATLLTLVLALPFGATAQTFLGGISGTVSDPTGAVVAGASVEAIETATNASHKTISSSAGEFAFASIPLGSYTVSISATGFKSIKVDRVPVVAGETYT